MAYPRCTESVSQRALAGWHWLDGGGWGLPRPMLDASALLCAVLVTVYWPGDTIPLGGAWPLVMYPALVMAIMWARGLYGRQLRVTILDNVASVVGAVSIATMMLVALNVYVVGGTMEFGALTHVWALSIGLLGGARIALVADQRLGRRAGTGLPTLIVGAGSVGQRLAQRLQDEPSYGLWPVGFLDADPLDVEWRADPRVPILGHPVDLERVVRAVGVRHVVLAFSNTSDSELVVLVQRCEALGLEVMVVPRLFDAVNERFRYETVGGLPLLSLRQTRPHGLGFHFKHAVDRVFALLALALLAPLLAVITAGVKLSSPGPVLFRQRRVGRDGKAFDLLKFRSMAPSLRDAEEYAVAGGAAPGGVEGVDRRTGIGRILRRTSLDELPQFLNVIRGDMSLVGPRPERPEFADFFSEHVQRYDDRHRVKSGITGWAQVHGLRGQTSLADRVEWDNYYIEHWSLGLDLRILALTSIAVFRGAE